MELVEREFLIQSGQEVHAADTISKLIERRTERANAHDIGYDTQNGPSHSRFRWNANFECKLSAEIVHSADKHDG